MFNKNRVEALSDGVFAIAMTLLVLDLKVPVGTAPGQLGAALLKDFHSWISFAVTFGIASVFWVVQHRLLTVLDNIGRGTVIPTFVFLAFVSVLPFSTSLWGHHNSDRLALAVYSGNQVAIAICLVAQLETARMHGHLRPGVESEMMRFRLYGMAMVLLLVTISMYLLPVEWVWPIPVALGISARLARRWKRRRLQAQPAITVL